MLYFNLAVFIFHGVFVIFCVGFFNLNTEHDGRFNLATMDAINTPLRVLFCKCCAVVGATVSTQVSYLEVNFSGVVTLVVFRQLVCCCITIYAESGNGKSGAPQRFLNVVLVLVAVQQLITTFATRRLDHDGLEPFDFVAHECFHHRAH